MSIHTFAGSGVTDWLSQVICKVTVLDRVSARKAAKKLKLMELSQTYACSPLIFLSLNSTKWLNTKIRNQFITETDGEMTLTKRTEIWIPTSIDKMLIYVRPILESGL